MPVGTRDWLERQSASVGGCSSTPPSRLPRPFVACGLGYRCDGVSGDWTKAATALPHCFARNGVMLSARAAIVHYQPIRFDQPQDWPNGDHGIRSGLSIRAEVLSDCDGSTAIHHPSFSKIASAQGG